MLSMNNIMVKLDGRPVLQSLNLIIPSGAIVGLVGQNGAGKSTTLKSIMGLVPVISGQILLDDNNILPLTTRKRVRLGIGYMPEDRRLIGSLTVNDNLLLPIWSMAKKDDEKLLDAIYDLLPEVKNMASHRASMLSGGQQKLVALARSILTAKKLLLLDEPLEGVAFALASRLAEAVKCLLASKPDISILVAESDINRMNLFTEVVHTIERGEIQ